MIAAEPGRVELQWIAPTGSMAETGYLIYRSGCCLRQVGQVTSVSDSTVAPDTSYSYVLYARDADDNQPDPSNAALVQTSTEP